MTLLCAGAFASMPYLDRVAKSLPGLQSAMIAVLICFSGMTAFLLFAQFYATRTRALVILGAAYLYLTLMGVPYLLQFTGVSLAGTQLGNPVASAWLSIAWTGGFSLFTLVYAVAQARDRAQVGTKEAWQLIAQAVAGIVVTVLILVTPIVISHTLPPAPMAKVGFILLALSALALVVTAIATRGRTVLHLWLIVALVALLLDVWMTSNYRMNGTLGWYVATGYRTLMSTLLLIPLLAELTAVSARMSTLAGLDGLTGLPNRRALDDRIEECLSDGKRRSDVLSVLMIDIDHFKPFNDNYGHAAGDEALRQVAKAINRALARAGDFVGRYGGEEFVVLLPDTDREGAKIVGERIRSGVARLPVKFAPGLQRITVSVGVASVPRSEIVSAGQVLGMADRALYHAKASGRNQVREASETLGIVRSASADKPYDGGAAAS